jgi:hypothetical protein
MSEEWWTSEQPPDLDLREAEARVRPPISIGEMRSAREGIKNAIKDIISEGHLVAGFYRVRLGRRSVWSPCRLWRGFGWESGTFHARGMWCWRASLYGKPVRVERVWPECAWYPIARSEYHYRMDLYRYAIARAPHLQEASPYRAIDFGELRFGFAKRKREREDDDQTP